VRSGTFQRGALLVLALAAAGSCGSDERPPSVVPGGAGTGGNINSAGNAGASGRGGGGAGGSAMLGGVVAGGAGAGGNAGSSPLDGCIPRDACQGLCGLLGDDAACGLGNTSQCGCTCEARFAGPCPGELDALLGCIGETPNVECGDRGRVFPGCESESFALDVCDFQARGELCAEDYPPCSPYCRGTLLASCPLGPESVSSCLCGCEQSYAIRCAAEFGAFMACTSNEPAFACDPAGRVVAAVCETEWQRLDACSRAPLLPDAGN
jgi:hypothetical protein